MADGNKQLLLQFPDTEEPMPDPAKTEQTPPIVSFLRPGSVDWSPTKPASEPAEKWDSEKETRKELREDLIHAMNMPNLIILAGCGCSMSAGGPSMGDLRNAVVVGKPKDQYNQLKSRDELRFVQWDDKNVEVLLSSIEALLRVTKDDDLEHFLNSAKGAILERSRSFLTDENRQKLEAHSNFLQKLARRRNRDSRVKLFTTNYDLCFEKAAANAGLVVIDGFSFANERRFDSLYFDYDIVRRPKSGDNHGSYLPGVFYLHKLHGSVDWARRGDKVVQVPEPDANEVCMVFPAQGKYEQSFTQPYFESVARYLFALREPGTCVIAVGFGMNDDHLSTPLVQAATTSVSMKLIVVDPSARAKSAEANSSNGNKHWSALFQSAKSGTDILFINADFEQFAAMIPDLQSRTEDEQLQKLLGNLGGRK